MNCLSTLLHFCGSSGQVCVGSQPWFRKSKFIFYSTLVTCLNSGVLCDIEYKCFVLYDIYPWTSYPGSVL